ncbi:MAG: tyrosine-type recombinase/integrase [Alkalilacustris sp.]
MIWLPEEVEAFVKGAPRYVGNILVVAVETGFRPGDLQLLERRQIEDISNGRKRLLVRTRKSNRRNFASVPVTRRFAELLDDLPGEQQRILVGEDGEPFEDSGSLGALITKWRTRLGIRSELRLYDARGTAVTRLVRAGCTLSELAAHMGWSLAHASQMLERYARLDPDMSNDILEKVERAERKQARRKEA